ncbi:hypothetical protein FN846DRAFT_981129 [Sphaerosporella brunnea]|uniref:RRM domain-containing protein n=1 Tax=Sphaerosporella brunnea TaxID=1250544 RepID=A0A5J5ECZ4_9PEZI|nr:hypothetical protein FN846DRAFT_981129 [Sphaerosporella brunnea]
MPDQLQFSRMATDQNDEHSATPRRYSPPSPETNDLNEFFGAPPKEWHTSGFRTKKALMRRSAAADDKEFNGRISIVKMAAATESFCVGLQCLITPGTIGTKAISEYTTASSRHISPLGNGHTANGVIGRNDSVWRRHLPHQSQRYQWPLNGGKSNGNVNGTEPTNSESMAAALDRLNITDSMNKGITGMGGANGYDSGFTGDSYMDNMANLLPGRDWLLTRTQCLPPLSTVGVNGFAQGGITSPMTAPPGAAPAILRHNFPISHPPANPADQNPPCNTLYVGNLPAQTSETIEDTHYATKALTSCGVRLSFSKNPLGVRSTPAASNPNAAAVNGTIPGAGGVPSHGDHSPAFGREHQGWFRKPAVRLPPGLQLLRSVFLQSRGDLRSPLDIRPDESYPRGPGPMALDRLLHQHFYEKTITGVTERT